VREAALNNLKQLTLFFGEKWMISQVFSSVAALTAEEVYLHRLTPLFAIGSLAEFVSPDVIKKNFMPVLTKMQNDPVPNVRMNVAKTIAVMAPSVSAHKDVCESMQRILEKLAKDSEFDVKHFAGVGLLKLKGV
jgi:serine/threonine-protein phosphatase 2A regulatory subunit A